MIPFLPYCKGWLLMARGRGPAALLPVDCHGYQGCGIVVSCRGQGQVWDDKKAKWLQRQTSSYTVQLTMDEGWSNTLAAMDEG